MFSVEINNFCLGCLGFKEEISSILNIWHTWLSAFLSLERNNYRTDLKRSIKIMIMNYFSEYNLHRSVNTNNAFTGNYFNIKLQRYVKFTFIRIITVNNFLVFLENVRILNFYRNLLEQFLIQYFDIVCHGIHFNRNSGISFKSFHLNYN